MSESVPPFVWTAVGVFSPETVRRRKMVCVRDYEPGDTYRYIWQKSQDVKLWYVVYRIVHAAIMLILLLISFFHIFVKCPMTEEAKDRYTCLGEYAQVNHAWPFYLTRWGLMLNFLQALMGLILVAKAYHRQSAVHPDHVETETSLNSPEPVQTSSTDRNPGGSPQKPTDTPQKPTDTTKKTTDTPQKPTDTTKKTTDTPQKPTDTPQKPTETPQKPSESSSKLTENEVVRTLPREHQFLSWTGTYWGVHTVASTLTILIDVVYWAALHNYSHKITIQYAYYVAEHGINLLLMGADCFIVAFPILAAHVVHLLFLGSAYLVVTLIYYNAGGVDMKFQNSYLYPFLDWSNPMMTCLNLVGITSFSIVTMLILMLFDFAKHKSFRPRPPTTTRGSTTSVVDPSVMNSV